MYFACGSTYLFVYLKANSLLGQSGSVTLVILAENKEEALEKRLYTTNNNTNLSFNDNSLLLVIIAVDPRH